MKRILLPLVITLMTCTLLHAQDTTSAQYVGKYIFPDGSVVPSVEVTLDNGLREYRVHIVLPCRSVNQ